MSDAATPGLTHAGGVVMSGDHDGARVLLVRASRPPHDWVLPKGHIERGEEPPETARREVREEAGVDAEVVRAMGDVRFVARGEGVVVRYFLMRRLRDVPAAEHRETRWCTVEEALRLLIFENARDVVRRSVALWNSDARPG
jgi:8-oxo-dGTP pyrophosphatase MutT (NUDIX family)